VITIAKKYYDMNYFDIILHFESIFFPDHDPQFRANLR
jgi:hypothetical protein